MPSIEVDRDICMGSGMCTVYAAGTFAQDGHAKVVVINPVGDRLSAIQTAVEACPTGALQLNSSN